MILEEETFKEFGYYSRDLKSKSGKKIIAKCNECGKIRKIQMTAYRDLCHKCGIKIYSTSLTNDEIEYNKKLIYILEQETYNKFGYYPSKLKPKSGKRILVRCKQCNRIIEMRKIEYHELCISCSNKEKSLGRYPSKETRLKMRNSHIGLMSLEKHPLWKGGISFEPYCVLFDDEFKERVREYWNRRCVVCGKIEILNGRKLDVHHVMYNKDTCCDGSPSLFVPLCQSCHMKSNFNREYWIKILMDIIYKRNKNHKCYYSKEEMESTKIKNDQSGISC